MKKIAALIFAAFMFSFAQTACLAQDGSKTLPTVQLSKPNFDKGVPLMQALKNRKSDRNISEEKLTPQQLSEILWAADGMNRETGKRTAPSSMGKYGVDIYAVLQEGIYKYDVKNHALEPVAAGDYRSLAGMQDFVYTAPLNLIYVADVVKNNPNAKTDGSSQELSWAYIEAGHQAQNVYLYCASEGLGVVARAMIKKEELSKTMSLMPGQVILYSQTVGYIKK